MRSPFFAAFAAASVIASSAVAAEGLIVMPGFRYPNVAGHQAVYGTPDAPLFWEGPELDNMTTVRIRSEGLVDIKLNFKIKNATPGGIVGLGGSFGFFHLGTVAEDGTFETGWVSGSWARDGFGYNFVRVGNLWPGGAVMEQSFDLYDFKGTGNQAARLPEPATWAMMILGFGGVGSAMRRRTSLSPKN